MPRLVLAALLCLAGPLRAGEAPADPAAKAKKDFAVHCVQCHGPDGRGDEDSARMNRVPAERLDLVKGPSAEHGEAETAKVIADGKGKMKPFKEKLEPEEIAALARYVASLRPRQEARRP